MIRSSQLADIEHKAFTFREINGIGSRDPIKLSSLLLRMNIITKYNPLSGRLGGMAIKAGSHRFMLVNSAHTVGKQHFTIAHELYHLCVQENFTSRQCITGLFEAQTDPEERNADLFAACLLLPEHGVIELIPPNERAKKNTITSQTLYKIQQNFGVSMKALIYRLLKLHLVDRTYFDAYSHGVKAGANMLGYETALFEPTNSTKTIGDYGTLARKLVENGYISESHYFELLNAIDVNILAAQEEQDDY